MLALTRPALSVDRRAHALSGTARSNTARVRAVPKVSGEKKNKAMGLLTQDLPTARQARRLWLIRVFT
jgi:hypothetical protein